MTDTYPHPDDGTIRWYDVDGETYGLTDDGRVLDADGCPLPEGPRRDVIARKCAATRERECDRCGEIAESLDANALCRECARVVALDARALSRN